MKRLALLLVILIFSISSDAFSDILVVISQKSTVSTIDKMTLSDIYLEHIHTFDNGSTVVPLNNRSLKNVFYSDVTGHDSYDLQSYWSDMVFTSHGQPPTTLPDDNSIMILVSNNPNMVGYIKDSSLGNRKDLKVIYTIKETDNNAP